jgi:hypothetical protein
MTTVDGAQTLSQAQPQSAGGLGQRRGGRGDERSGRQVGQALDGQRRALDRLAPAVVRDARGGQPVPPDVAGGGHPGEFWLQAFSHLALIEAAARMIIAESLEEWGA